MVFQQLGPFPLVAPTAAPAPAPIIGQFPMIEPAAAPVPVINDIPQYWTEDPEDFDVLPSPPLPRPTTSSTIKQFRDSPVADALPVSMNAVRDIGPPSVDHTSQYCSTYLILIGLIYIVYPNCWVTMHH